MKKTKDKNQPVTIGDFQEFTDFAVKTFATKQDLKDELKGYATKDDLKETESRIVKKMDSVIRVAVKEELRPIEERIHKKLSDFTDKILRSNDRIAGELAAVRQEKIMHIGTHDRQEKTVQEHGSDIKHLKQRVAHLEVKAGIA